MTVKQHPPRINLRQSRDSYVPRAPLVPLKYSAESDYVTMTEDRTTTQRRHNCRPSSSKYHLNPFGFPIVKPIPEENDAHLEQLPTAIKSYQLLSTTINNCQQLSAAIINCTQLCATVYTYT